jgi:hypothetical protein
MSKSQESSGSTTTPEKPKRGERKPQGKTFKRRGTEVKK